MHTIQGKTLNEVILKAYQTLRSHGTPSPSRNNGSVALYNTTFKLENPRNRHLFLAGRKSNIFQMIAETFWVMAGANVLDPYLTFFLPRAPQYSDDGATWHGAYGPRMYAYDQLMEAASWFTKDNKYTRRSQVGIFQPDQDNQSAVEARYGKGHTPKDVPCNSLLYFYITPDDHFHAHTTQRSGDLLFGTGSINPFEFSFLQELMYHEVKKAYPEIKLGYYSWYVNNAHVYDAFADQPAAVLSQEHPELEDTTMPLVGPDINAWEDFFGELVARYGALITMESVLSVTFQGELEHIDLTFDAYGVQKQGNLLYEYAKLILIYILQKKANESLLLYKIHYPLPPDDEQEEFQYAILKSPFRKFGVV